MTSEPTAHVPEQPRHREYEDQHYHDDPEPIPLDDTKVPRKPLAQRKPVRKLPKRRYYEED